MMNLTANRRLVAQLKSQKVEGVLSQLPPLKSGKYFDGSLSDDTSSIRVIGFDIKKQEQLAKMQEKR